MPALILVLNTHEITKIILIILLSLLRLRAANLLIFFRFIYFTRWSVHAYMYVYNMNIWDTRKSKVGFRYHRTIVMNDCRLLCEY